MGSRRDCPPSPLLAPLVPMSDVLFRICSPKQSLETQEHKLPGGILVANSKAAATCRHHMSEDVLSTDEVKSSPIAVLPQLRAAANSNDPTSGRAYRRTTQKRAQTRRNRPRRFRQGS